MDQSIWWSTVHTQNLHKPTLTPPTAVHKQNAQLLLPQQRWHKQAPRCTNSSKRHWTWASIKPVLQGLQHPTTPPHSLSLFLSLREIKMTSISMQLKALMLSSPLLFSLSHSLSLTVCERDWRRWDGRSHTDIWSGDRSRNCEKWLHLISLYLFIDWKNPGPWRWCLPIRQAATVGSPVVSQLKSPTVPLVCFLKPTGAQRLPADRRAAKWVGAVHVATGRNCMRNTIKLCKKYHKIGKEDI